jgi:hypothetical protein
VFQEHQPTPPFACGSAHASYVVEPKVNGKVQVPAAPSSSSSPMRRLPFVFVWDGQVSGKTHLHPSLPQLPGFQYNARRVPYQRLRNALHPLPRQLVVWLGHKQSPSLSTDAPLPASQMSGVVVVVVVAVVVHAACSRVWVVDCRFVHPPHPTRASHASAASRWSVVPPQLVPSVCCGFHWPHSYV